MAAAGNDLLMLTVVAASPIAAYRCVGFDNAQADDQGQKVKGVAIARAAIGEATAVVVAGTAMVVAGAATAVGDSLICDAQGRAIPAVTALGLATGAVAVTSSAAAGPLVGTEPPDYVFADALTAATAAGDIIEVLLRR